MLWNKVPFKRKLVYPSKKTHPLLFMLSFWANQSVAHKDGYGTSASTVKKRVSLGILFEPKIRANP